MFRSAFESWRFERPCTKGGRDATARHRLSGSFSVGIGCSSVVVGRGGGRWAREPMPMFRAERSIITDLSRVNRSGAQLSPERPAATHPRAGLQFP